MKEKQKRSSFLSRVSLRAHLHLHFPLSCLSGKKAGATNWKVRGMSFLKLLRRHVRAVALLVAPSVCDKMPTQLATCGIEWHFILLLHTGAGAFVFKFVAPVKPFEKQWSHTPDKPDAVGQSATKFCLAAVHTAHIHTASTHTRTLVMLQLRLFAEVRQI